MPISKCDTSLGIKFWRKSSHRTSNDALLSWDSSKQRIPSYHAALTAILAVASMYTISWYVNQVINYTIV